VLLIAPAAIHRLAFHGQDDEKFHSLGSAIVTAALLPLSLGMAADVYVATLQMLDDGRIALGAASVALAFLVAVWFAVPLLLAQRQGRSSPKSQSAA
jgi:hypothetical protein